MQRNRRTSCECLTKKIPKLVIIYYRGRGQQAPAKAPIHLAPKVVIKVPIPFHYASDKAVLWNYTKHVALQKPQAVRVSPEIKQEPSVNDIEGIDGLTCSGRCCAPGLLVVKEGG